MKSNDYYDEDNRAVDIDNCDGFRERHTAQGPKCGSVVGNSGKRTKHALSSEEFGLGNVQEVSRISHINPQYVHIDMNQACTKSSDAPKPDDVEFGREYNQNKNGNVGAREEAAQMAEMSPKRGHTIGENAVEK